MSQGDELRPSHETDGPRSTRSAGGTGNPSGVRSRFFLTALVLGLLATMVAATGCEAIMQKATEKAVEGIANDALKKEGIEVDLSEKGGTVKTKDGDISVGEDVKIPADFPKNIPLHPKGKVIMVTSQISDAMIAMEIKDSKEKVMAFYKDEMEKSGWTIDTTIPAPDMLIATNTDKQRLMVNVGDKSEEEGTVTVSVTMGQDTSATPPSSAPSAVPPTVPSVPPTVPAP